MSENSGGLHVGYTVDGRVAILIERTDDDGVTVTTSISLTPDAVREIIDMLADNLERAEAAVALFASLDQPDEP